MMKSPTDPKHPSRPPSSPTSHLPDAEAHQYWEWDQSLATAEPGRRYRVTSAVFTLVQERCGDLGCAEGDELTCVENDSEGVTLATSGKRILFIERTFAWLVRVEPV